jgi:hypothetical protein
MVRMVPRMRALAISAILVLGLGCSSGQPDSQTPQGGPSASVDSVTTEPPPSAAPVAPDPTPTAAPTAAPVADAHELSLEKADVKKAINKITPSLRKCLKKASKKDTDLKGQTTLAISIGADGSVSSVSASASDGLTDKMIDCLKAAASKAKFEAPPAGSATVSLPLELEAKK